MGSGSTVRKRYDLTSHFSLELHPIEGQVPLFKLRGLSLFLFTTKSSSSEFRKIAQKVEGSKHPNLCSYYGNLFANHNISYEEAVQCCGQSRDRVYSFWTFQNYTLAADIERLKREQKQIKELPLWNLIKTLAQCAKVLMEEGIYLDFNFHNIQISPLKKTQVYWGNFRENYSHRQFYQYQHTHKLSSKEGISPEELKALIKKKTIVKLDLQKCVMHSLGRLILLYANNKSQFTEILDYDTLDFKIESMNKMMEDMKEVYSEMMVDVLAQMLEESPEKRLSFNKLLDFMLGDTVANQKLRLEMRGSVGSPTNSQKSGNQTRVSEF